MLRSSVLPKEEIYLKKKIWHILENTELEGLEEAIEPYPLTKIISHFISAFLHLDERVRWKAIYAFGITSAKIAKEEIEKARILMRRLMWMLNEESGGMAWGVGEAFGETLYHSEQLRREYLQIYVSYIWPEGNYLDFPPAQRGIIWGVGRLAQRYTEELVSVRAQEYLIFHLNSQDDGVLLLTLWSLRPFQRCLDMRQHRPIIEKAFEILMEKRTSLIIFDGIKIRPWDFQEAKKFYQS
ncbi:MAG: hypothetical protein RMI93_02680 [Caldimicrobium sp.]|nr:hypothetical protein [Caldimicrobium sp.]MDW8182498.1 hypothetical protein [Caldimicrobium sp.]